MNNGDDWLTYTKPSAFLPSSFPQTYQAAWKDLHKHQTSRKVKSSHLKITINVLNNRIKQQAEQDNMIKYVQSYNICNCILPDSPVLEYRNFSNLSAPLI